MCVCVCSTEQFCANYTKKTEFFASFKRGGGKDIIANYAWTPCFIFQSSTHVHKETITK